MRVLILAGLGAASLGCTGLLGGDDDKEGDGLFGSADDEDGETEDDGSADPDGDGLSNDEEDALGTDGDELDSDGDGWSDGEEVDGNTDPKSDESKPYEGGWPIGDCAKDIQAEGYNEGDVSRDWVMMDQFGEDVNLHGFCDNVVYLVFAAFW